MFTQSALRGEMTAMQSFRASHNAIKLFAWVVASASVDTTLPDAYPSSGPAIIKSTSWVSASPKNVVFAVFFAPEDKGYPSTPCDKDPPKGKVCCTKAAPATANVFPASDVVESWFVQKM